MASKSRRNAGPAPVQVPNQVDQASAEAAVDGSSAALAEGQTEALGGAAPLASEPLQPNRVNALAQTITSTIEELSGGQIQVPPMPEVTEELEQLPPEIFAGLVAISAFTEQFPAAEKHRFDPTEFAADNAGLADAIGTVGGISRDKEVVRAIQSSPVPEAGEEVGEEAVEDEAGEAAAEEADEDFLGPPPSNPKKKKKDEEE